MKSLSFIYHFPKFQKGTDEEFSFKGHLKITFKRKSTCNKFASAWFSVVDQIGLEPMTSRLWVCCSNQLSYKSGMRRLPFKLKHIALEQGSQLWLCKGSFFRLNDQRFGLKILWRAIICALAEGATTETRCWILKALPLRYNKQKAYMQKCVLRPMQGEGGLI